MKIIGMMNQFQANAYNYQISMNKYQEELQDSQMYQLFNSHVVYFSSQLWLSNDCSIENGTQRQQISSKTILSQPYQSNSSSKTKRSDNKPRCFCQNLKSYLLTIISKILPSQHLDKKLRKLAIKEIRAKVKHFLTQNKVENNQLILLFVCLFLKLQSVETHQFDEIKSGLIAYLDKRQGLAQKQISQGKIKLRAKIAINRLIIQKYFGPKDVQIDAQWIKNMCGEMFTGRKKNTIDKPISKLIDLQKQLNTVRNSITHLNFIQSCLEL